MARTKQTARKSSPMSIAVAMRNHAFDAMKTLACYAEQVEKEACANREMPEHFCFDRNGETTPPSDMVCHVWDKIDEMLQSINAPNNVAGRKRRTTDPDWCDADRFHALKEANIAKLVAMTDAAARLGQDVVEQTAFVAWKNLLESADPEARAEAQRLFDKELGLPAPPMPGLGASQTTAGQVLDGTLSSAKRPKYAVLSADESAAAGGGGGGKYAVLSADESATDIGGGGGKYAVLSANESANEKLRATAIAAFAAAGADEVKYRPAVGHETDADEVKYRPAVVMDEDEETPRYANLAAA